MKKLIILLSCLFVFNFISCSNDLSKNSLNKNINNTIAVQLENLDKNYSIETLKALSIILRTNNIINNTDIKNKRASDKYLSIAKQTQNKVIKDSDNNLIEISLDNSEEYHWQKTIKKSLILEFALKNNINLSNISKIDPILDNDKVVGINIGNKYFDYNSLSKEFGLESNVIENIETTKKDIIIKGKNKGFYGNFSIEESEQLSNDNYNYKDILKTFFNDLKIN